MTEDSAECDTLEEALNRAMDAMLPPDDPDKLDPNYPADYTPEDRVDHVLHGEYPRWQNIEWIAAAADTDKHVCRSVVQKRLSEGKVELSKEGIRRNRYYSYFTRVESITKRVQDNPGLL